MIERYTEVREYIDGAAFREMLLCARDALEANRQAINELNVFPVPDGDTGTNMTLTVSAAAEELRSLTDERVSVSAVADKAASAMLRGARGNSGVILSLLFRGLARELKGLDVCFAPDFTAALCAGVDAAYKAVMKPAEGTILTVSRKATDGAALLAQTEADVERVLARAIADAKEALVETTFQNPVLARAGVVDAGGKGYVIILEAFLDSLQGKVTPTAGGSAAVSAEGGAEESAFEAFSTEEITFTYDTVFTMRKPAQQVKDLDLLRAYLDSIGDSLVISEDDEMFKVHVHTDEPAAALTESAKYGVLEVAKIENMRSQHDALLAGRKIENADTIADPDGEGNAAEVSAPEAGADAKPEIAPAEKRYGFVSVCAGEGLAELFRELGCDGVVAGGQTMNPSTEELLNAVNQTPAETVFILPNNKNLIMAAEQCQALTEKRVIVIPTKTVPQGVSAMLQLDDTAEPEAIAEAFKEAAGKVRTIQVTYAARDSEYDGHKIKAGEYLCLMDDALLGSSGKPASVAKLVCKTAKKHKAEFVTVYYGADVPEAEAQKLCDAISSSQDVDVTLVNGGQPVYYLLIAIE